MIPSVFDRSAQYHIFDDFFSNSSAGSWLVTKGTGGTVAVETGGSIIDLPTAASANDYILLSTPTAAIVAGQKKDLEFECRFKFVEANTNNCILAFGISSVIATGFMQNGTAGPPASFNGAVFYMVSGGLNLGFRTSAGSANTDNPTFATLVSGTTYTLGMSFDFSDATNVYVTPSINGQLGLGVLLKQSQVRQAAVYTGWTNLYPIAAVRAGSASAETLSVDYISVIGNR